MTIPYGSMQKLKNWKNSEGKYITLREYNKLAQKARREGINVTEYLISLDYKLSWGEGKGKGHKKKNA